MTELLSWNVLAPAYALPGRYAGVPADHLAAATRVPRLRVQLAGLLPTVDVLALQEVDAELAGWLRLLPGAAVAYRQRPGSMFILPDAAIPSDHASICAVLHPV